MNKFLLPILAAVISACSPAAMQTGGYGASCTPTVAEKQAWDGAVRANTPAAYRAYLAKYPSGCFAGKAAQKLGRPVAATAVAPVVVTDAAGNGNRQRAREAPAKAY